MSRKSVQYVLGSRSPRRLELLQKIVPPETILVLPPRSAAESGFAGLHERSAIERRLQEIARRKCDDVLDQLRSSFKTLSGWLGSNEVSPQTLQFLGARKASTPATHREKDFVTSQETLPIVITADTEIVATDRQGRAVVLGQPPDDETWKETVRRWFREFYTGRTHLAATALCVTTPDGPPIERVVTSEVTFHADVERRLEWYLETGEPRGKAGGYAIQDAGGIFVARVEGSLSNVIGLPLRELMESLEELEKDHV